MKKNLLIFSFILSLAYRLYAQNDPFNDSTVLCKFPIIAAYDRAGNNYTEFYVQNDSFIMIYQRQDKLHFAIVVPKEQSYSWGELNLMLYDEDKEDENNKKNRVYVGIWKFQNSYDTKQGEAAITLGKNDYENQVIITVNDSGYITTIEGNYNILKNWLSM